MVKVFGQDTDILIHGKGIWPGHLYLDRVKVQYLDTGQETAILYMVL